MWPSKRLAGLVLVLVAGSGCGNKQVTDAYARQVGTASMRVATLEAMVSASEQRIDAMEEAVRERGQADVTHLETIEDVTPR